MSKKTTCPGDFSLSPSCYRNNAWVERSRAVQKLVPFILFVLRIHSFRLRERFSQSTMVAKETTENFPFRELPSVGGGM